MINFINENYDRHIITLEDPIEYYHKHKKCTVNQREIGVDVPDFKEGIRRALRMDPDIILVGEMRDLETIHAAIEAAETGHVVFGTLHTSGASSTINRIIDVFPKDQQDQIRTQLSTALIGVLSQTLLPKKPEGVVAAYEMMVVTPAIQNLIRENKTYRIDSQHPDRPQARHVPAGREPVQACGRTAWSRRKKCCCGPPSRPSWPPGSPPPNAGWRKRESTTRTRRTKRTRTKTRRTTRTTSRRGASVGGERTDAEPVAPRGQAVRGRHGNTTRSARSDRGAGAGRCRTSIERTARYIGGDADECALKAVYLSRVPVGTSDADRGKFRTLATTGRMLRQPS